MKRIATTILVMLVLASVASGAMTYSASRFVDPTYSVYRNSADKILDPEYLFANEVEGYLEGTGVFPSLSILESTGATYYTKLQGGNQSANLTLTLPTAYAGSNGYVLSSTTGGVLSWIANAGTFAGGAITSDITMTDGEYIRPEGTTAAQTVALQAYDIDNTAWRNVLTADNHATVVPVVLGDSAASLAIASTAFTVSTAGAVSGVTTLAATDNISLANGKSLVSSTTTAQSASIKVYDNDTGPGYVNALSWTNGNAPAVVLGSANGTTVITTSDWGIDATGTATGIASMQFDSGTTIYCTNVVVSNAECKTLYSAPKVLVAAPGTHNFIDVVSVVLFYDYASAAFNTAANNLTVEYKTDASGPTATGTLSQTGFLDQTVDGVAKVLPVAVANQVVAAVENQPVVLYCATADPTTGGGVLRVAISYRVMPTGF
jgi:hypothetical protein